EHELLETNSSCTAEESALNVSIFAEPSALPVVRFRHAYVALPGTPPCGASVTVDPAQTVWSEPSVKESAGATLTVIVSCPTQPFASRTDSIYVVAVLGFAV